MPPKCQQQQHSTDRHLWVLLVTSKSRRRASELGRGKPTLGRSSFPLLMPEGESKLTAWAGVIRQNQGINKRLHQESPRNSPRVRLGHSALIPTVSKPNCVTLGYWLYLSKASIRCVNHLGIIIPLPPLDLSTLAGWCESVLCWEAGARDLELQGPIITGGNFRLYLCLPLLVDPNHRNCILWNVHQSLQSCRPLLGRAYLEGCGMC